MTHRKSFHSSLEHPAQSLLLAHLAPAEDARLLILEGGDGQLALEAARMVPKGEVLTLARDVRQVWAAQKRLEVIQNAAAGSEVIPSIGGWDQILLTIPKERRYARSLLVAAWCLLKPGGKLLLAGPTRQGAKAIIKDADRLFSNAIVLEYRSHQRIATCTRGDSPLHPLPKEFQQPGVAPATIHTFEVPRPERILNFETHPGIFSWDTVDEGTALLVQNLVLEPGFCIWDVGCGYGLIGLTAALMGAAKVFLSDINLLAINYTQKNLVRNGLEENCIVFPADGLRTPDLVPPGVILPAENQCDLIVSNPAFHQDRQVDRSMADELIQLAPTFLAPGGRLLLVANRFLNYDRMMRKYFRHVTPIVQTNKFHLIQASN